MNSNELVIAKSNTCLSVTRVAGSHNSYISLICTYNDNMPVYEICTEKMNHNKDGTVTYIYTNPVIQIVRRPGRDTFRDALTAFRTHVSSLPAQNKDTTHEPE